ncbi:MAG TPA: hypothetical protein VE843_00030 [Ktedonobacteraceae bacterium]|nr:hypothetical protein [Ktedonobacteraceae bacterium]
MHAINSRSEPGMVQAWHLESHEKPPSRLMSRLHQTATQDERFFYRGSK